MKPELYKGTTEILYLLYIVQFYVNIFTYIYPISSRGIQIDKPKAGALVKTSSFANPCTYSRINKELKKRKILGNVSFNAILQYAQSAMHVSKYTNLLLHMKQYMYFQLLTPAYSNGNLMSDQEGVSRGCRGLQGKKVVVG